MMSNFVQIGGVPTKTRRVFLRSGTANEGYAVCYNWDAVGVTMENDATSLNTAITDWCDARRGMVDVPDAGNNMHFAGVVDRKSDGVVGPNWIVINEPGSICNIYTDSVITTNAGDTPPIGNPTLVTFTIGTHSAASFTTLNGVFKFNGLPGEGSAWALEETTTTPQLVMAQLQTGPPSGGVQAIGSNATVTALAVFSDLPTIVHGKLVTSTADLDATVLATISVPRAVTNHFPGQRCIYDMGGFANTTAVIHVISMGSVRFQKQGGTAAGTSLEILTAALASAGVSGAGYLDLEWDGTWWIAKSYSLSSALLTD
jgi:hypothetical protein